MAPTDTMDGIGRESHRSGPYVRAVRWIESLGETAFAYFLLLPALLILATIAFWPLLRTLQMSLHADTLYGAKVVGEFVGLKNYVELLTGQRAALLVRPLMPTIIWNAKFPFVHDVQGTFHAALTVTFVFTIVAVFFETIIGFGQALVLDQDFHGRRWVRVAIILPWAVPIVIQGMIFFLLFQPGIGFLVGNGTLFSLVVPFTDVTLFTIPTLSELGLFSGTPLANSTDSMIILIFADIWKTSAFMALLILAGLQSIDRSLYDVARVSGATRWQQFKLVTLPLIFPTVMVAMLFRTIASLRIYGLIETVTSCSTVPSLSCLVVTTFSSGRYATAAAIAFITAAIIAAVVSVYIVKFAQSQTS